MQAGGPVTPRYEIYRKIALYTQDKDRNVIERYTPTTPELIARNEIHSIQCKTYVRDVCVGANKFHVYAVKQTFTFTKAMSI